uniref:Laminin IV type A domain-containing protein n=1 Tax=Heterorhabditis bacteriophora TaxID=37862 RepID=A0A1I7X384_HETBA
MDYDIIGTIIELINRLCTYHHKPGYFIKFQETPANFNSYPTDATPLYWQLPRAMLGDRTTSYNGFIRFKVLYIYLLFFISSSLLIWNEDNRRSLHGVRPDQQYFRYFPQLILVGNNRIELEHIPQDISESGKYKIRLHESEWRSRHFPEVAVTRKLLMIALQNLQGIYIRGTYNYPARGDAITISEVRLIFRTFSNIANYLFLTSLGKEYDTCIAANHGRGYVCNSCKPGYTGQYCEGLVLVKFKTDIFCLMNLAVLINILNIIYIYIYIYIERERERNSCDQGCHMPLMITVDELEITLARQNFSSLRPIPWKRLKRIDNSTNHLKFIYIYIYINFSHFFQNFDFISIVYKCKVSLFMKSLEVSSNLDGTGEMGDIVKNGKYAKEAFGVIEEARFQMERINKSSTSLKQFENIAENLILDTQLIYANVFNTTQFLKHFHMFGGSSVGGVTLDAWSVEAEAHYNATVERGEYIEKRHNRAEHEHKSALLSFFFLSFYS